MPDCSFLTVNIQLSMYTIVKLLTVGDDSHILTLQEFGYRGIALLIDSMHPPFRPSGIYVQHDDQYFDLVLFACAPDREDGHAEKATKLSKLDSIDSELCVSSAAKNLMHLLALEKFVPVLVRASLSPVSSQSVQVNEVLSSISDLLHFLSNKPVRAASKLVKPKRKPKQ